MDRLNLQPHYVLPMLLSIFFIVVLLALRKKIYRNIKWRAFWISLTVFFMIYLFILFYAAYIEFFYNIELEKFDLNKDGVFSGNEITLEQQAAMHKVTNDTARNFAPITAVFISAFIASTVFIVGKIVECIKGKSYNNKP